MFDVVARCYTFFRRRCSPFSFTGDTHGYDPVLPKERFAAAVCSLANGRKRTSAAVFKEIIGFWSPLVYVTQRAAGRAWTPHTSDRSSSTDHSHNSCSISFSADIFLIFIWMICSRIAHVAGGMPYTQHMIYSSTRLLDWVCTTYTDPAQHLITAD